MKVINNTPAAPAEGIASGETPVMETASVKEVHLDDDRKSISAGDKTILIVEDDVNLAKTYLMEARSSGFRVLVAMNGNDAVILAKKYLPSGIILDINLPKKNGWDVLKELKEFAETSRIPVHIVSSEDIAKSRSAEAGAVSVSTKPVTSESVQKILSSLDSAGASDSGRIFLFSDKEEHRAAMEEFLGQNGAQVVSLRPEISISEQLQNQEASAIILDVSSRKIKLQDVLKELQRVFAGKSVSVIILASAYLSPMDLKRIDAFKDSFQLKIVKSYSDVAEEVRLFFHYITKVDNQKILRPLVDSSRIMENRKILVVDDDEQNLFSIRKLLEVHKAKVMEAKNGREALEIFEKNPEIDLILMDVMMPVMDGYEATQEIRKMTIGKNIPIITLTAKSHPEEREKCLANGSSDFITKPLDADQLIGLIKVWLGNASKK